MITSHSDSLSHRLRRNSAEGSTERSTGSLDARTAIGSLLILILVSLLGWLYLTQASQVTTTGYRIYELERERARFQRENAKLMLEIAELERLEVVEARARQLGFVPPDQVEYLVVADYPPDYPSSGQLAATFGEEDLALDSPQQEKIGSEARGAALPGWWEKMVSQFNIWIVVQPGSAMAEGTP
jgi:cell division protein FtsB